MLADDGGEEALWLGSRRLHPHLILAPPETVCCILAMCAGRLAAAAVPAMANDAAGKEAARMENDEVGLLVVLPRGAGA